MTISSTISSLSYTTNGSTTVFQLSNLLYNDTSHIKASHIDTSTNIKTDLFINADFTLTGNGAVGSGILTTTSALTAGYIEIWRDSGLVQTRTFTENDGTPSKQLEEGLDEQVLRNQETSDFTETALHRQRGDVSTSMALPLASARQGKILKFAADGSPALGPSSDLLEDAINNALGKFNIQNLEKVSTRAAMTALPKSGLLDGDQLYVLGYHSATDGVGALAKWNASSTANANGGSVFNADEGGTGRWHIDLPYSANVKMFGAVGDGATDDTSAIQAAIDAVTASQGGEVFLPVGIYKITTGLSIVSRFVSMRGVGGTASVIECHSCNGLNFRSATYDNGSSYFSDFGLTGAPGSSANWAAIESVLPPSGVSGTDSRDGLHFVRLRIYDWNQGAIITDTHEFSFTHCKFQKVNNPINMGVYALNGRINDNFMVFDGGDSHAGSQPANAIDITGGSCEGHQIIKNQIFGFDIGVNAVFGIFINILDNDMSCEVNCIQVGTIQNQLNIKNNYIEVRGNSGIGIFGTGLSSEINSKVLVEGNNFIRAGTSPTSITGLKIHSSNTNQFHWRIVGNLFTDFDVNDIECTNAGDLTVEDNRCTSTSPTNSISITSVATNHPVYIRNNICAAAINTTAADVAAGRVIVGNNVVSGVQAFGAIHASSGSIDGVPIGSSDAEPGTFTFIGVDGVTELTISGGSITPTRSYHSVDTEADAASDNLDTIVAPTASTFLILRPADGARTVNVRAGVDNIFLENGATFAMDNTSDRLFLMSEGPNWYEVTRSDNGA